MRTCAGEECLNPVGARTGALCESCARRKQRDKERKKAYKPRADTPFGAVLEASINLADVDTDDEAAYAKAKDVIRWAALRWARHLMREQRKRRRAPK